jgi:cyclic lactone autoinducer peptide
MTGPGQIHQGTFCSRKDAEALRIWDSFVTLLQTGQIAAIPIHPYIPALLEPLQGFLQNRYQDADWREWKIQPEVRWVKDQIHFLLDLTLHNERDRYCFSFLLEDGQWYFQHVEGITLCLDRLDPLPTSRFPEVSETKKACIREEIRVTEMVRLYNWLIQEKGRDFAYQWFRDGEGYVLAAKTWVPFVPAHRAFILYLCWEQSCLRGSAVTLLELDDQAARVAIIPIDFLLYQQTGHLKQQIAFQEYRCLFEAIWTDRARKASWKVAFAYKNERCMMYFYRPELPEE